MESLIISFLSFHIVCGPGVAQDNPKPQAAAQKPQAVEAKPAAQQQDPITATDEAALTAAIGKNVVVTGKVRDSNLSPATATVRIYFAGSGFRLLIEPDHFDASEGWGIEEKIGKVIYARGKVVKADGFLQISLTKPNQMAASPDKLAKAPPVSNTAGTEEKKVFEPV